MKPKDPPKTEYDRTYKEMPNGLYKVTETKTAPNGRYTNRTVKKNIPFKEAVELTTTTKRRK